jgi:hypothetical protein
MDIGGKALQHAFFLYSNDAEALLREDELVNQLGASQQPLCFTDAAFPSCGQALYRTPQQPPAGAMPASIVQVYRAKTTTFICRATVVRGGFCNCRLRQ